MCEIIEPESNPAYKIPANVLKITSELPEELQCLILKSLILTMFIKPENLNSPGDGFSDMYYSANFPSLIVSLLDVHPTLDNVMSMVLQQLDVNNLFWDDNIHFDKIADFVISRSIPLNLIQIDSFSGGLDFDRQPKLVPFFHCCRSLEIYIGQFIDPTEFYLDHVTTLLIDSDSLHGLWKAGKFQKTTRLNRLVVTVDFTEKIYSMKKALKDWASLNYISLSQPRDNRPDLVLNIMESNVEGVSMVEKYLTELVDVVAENKETWHVTAWMDEINFTAKLIDQYSKLFDEIESVEKLKLDLQDEISMDVVNEISEIEDFSLSRCQFTLMGSTFHFRKMASLKKLSLGLCELTFPFFKSLPDTLESLEVELEYSNLEYLMLPIHLKVLKMKTVHFPELTNGADLDSLNKVILELDTSGEKPMEEDVLETLQVFISDLPSTVKSFELNDRCECLNPPIGHTIFHNSFQPEYLKLDGSIFPSVFERESVASLRRLNLTYTTSSPYIPQLPSTIETLEISKDFYIDGPVYLAEFWKRYISPLKNLLQLRIMASGTFEKERIDLRTVEFPPFLSRVTIQFMDLQSKYILVDKLSKNLEVFEISNFSWDSFDSKVVWVACNERSEIKKLMETFKSVGNIQLNWGILKK
ncbi:unnamed protein product [Ambrosiozyma monospora]|uniref:Unnamed protein product n=1 Tax=Ambrosiozyma monospora TaxID=43982 RepID=A0A9W6YVJ5_AMBMO|nr:unnamed protein product [Ambrosiozyma monospora]